MGESAGQLGMGSWIEPSFRHHLCGLRNSNQVSQRIIHVVFQTDLSHGFCKQAIPSLGRLISFISYARIDPSPGYVETGPGPTGMRSKVQKLESTMHKTCRDWSQQAQDDVSLGSNMGIPFDNQ